MNYKEYWDPSHPVFFEWLTDRPPIPEEVLDGHHEDLLDLLITRCAGNLEIAQPQEESDPETGQERKKLLIETLGLTKRIQEKAHLNKQKLDDLGPSFK